MFNQILMLFAFILVGLILGKSGKLKSSDAGVLSSLEVYLFLPCMNFLTFSEKFTVAYIKENYILLLFSSISIIALHLLGTLFSKLTLKDAYDKEVFRYSTVITNYGYMGYALVAASLGEDALLDFAFFTIPFSFYIYTYAFGKLTGSKGGFKKLANPPLIAIVIGCIFGLSGIAIPDIAASILEASSACMAPVSMLLTGLAISEFKMLRLIGNIKVYIITAARLIIVPAIISLAVFIVPKTVALNLLLYCALPCGLNTVVFPKFAGKDCRLGAGLALVSNLFACATMPLWVQFASRVLNLL